MPDLRVFDVFGEQSGRRNPPLPFWGCIIQKQGFFRSFVVQNLVSWFFCAYTQVHWCAALFCSTSQEQTKIPQIRPNSRVLDGWGENFGGRNPPIPILGPDNPKKRGNFWRKSSIGRYTGVQHCSAGPAQSRQKYPKIGQISRFSIFLDKTWIGGTPPPLFWGRTNPIKRSFPATNLLLLTL